MFEGVNDEVIGVKLKVKEIFVIVEIVLIEVVSVIISGLEFWIDNVINVFSNFGLVIKKIEECGLMGIFEYNLWFIELD